MKTQTYLVSYGNGGRQKCRGVIELGRFIQHLIATYGFADVTVEIYTK